MEARLRVALCVQNALEPVEGIGLEGEDPLVVAHAEARQGRALDIGVLGEAVAAVLGHDPRALLGGQEVPVVGADEGVDGDPVAGGDSREAGGDVAAVELRGRVLAHDGPDRVEVVAQRRGEQGPVGLLDRRRIIREPPHEEVGVGAEARDVVGPAQLDALDLDRRQGVGDEGGALGLIGGEGDGGGEYGGEAVVEAVVDRVDVDVLGVARIVDVVAHGVLLRRLG